MSAAGRAHPRGRTTPGVLLLALAWGVAVATAAPPPRPLLLDAAVTAEGAIVAVGGRGVIQRSTDAGRTWQGATGLPYTTFTGVSFAPDQPARGWVVGHEDVILATTDAGRTWIHARAASDLERSFLDVLALDARRIIAVGAFGLYLSSRDGGQTWRARSILEEDLHLNQLTRADDGTLYLAGEAGTLLRSTDDGDTWEDIATAYPGSFFGVLPLPDGGLIAHGLRGTLYHSTDRGDTWEELPVRQPVILQSAAASPSGRLILVGGQARMLLVSRDGGHTFTLSPQPPQTALAKILRLPDGVWLGFGEGGVTRLPLP
jgi:photosystem II stability/assembly factor-like uncharacterized protein